MKRDDLFTELRGYGLSGSLEDMLVEDFGETDLNSYIYENIDNTTGGLENHIQKSENILQVIGLPDEDILSYIRTINGTLTNIIGLSVDDYSSVDPTLRDIFFIDASTLRLAADAYALAIASPLLNTGEMLGDEYKRVVLLYADGTSQTILDKATSWLARQRNYLLDPWNDTKTWDDTYYWSEVV